MAALAILRGAMSLPAAFKEFRDGLRAGLVSAVLSGGRRRASWPT